MKLLRHPNEFIPTIFPSFNPPTPQIGKVHPPTPQLGGLKRLPVLKVPHMGVPIAIGIGGGFKRGFRELIFKWDLGVKKLRKELPLLLLFTIFIAFPSCHPNRLKTSEKTLAEEILLQEQENEGNDRAAREKQLADGSGNSNGGIRYKEDRSVYRTSPPVVIDIAGSLQNVREIELSDIASEITYIRIQTPPDSSFRRDIKFTYHLTDNYIIASNIFGIIHYDREGRYVNTIVKNQFTGVKIEQDKIIGYSEFTFIGAYNTNVTSSGNTLYYNYFNNIAGQEYLMKYDCSANQIGQTIKYDAEDPSKIIGQGEPVVDLNHGKSDSAPKQRNPGGMWSSRSPNPGFLSRSYRMEWIDDEHYSKILDGSNMLGIFNSNGDTLSAFTQHEKLVNYKKSLQRGTDGGSHYKYNGKTYFRNAFNDTIFQVIPPNRLKPVFVLNLGTYKVTRQQGVDPGFDLTGKIIPWEMAETEKYIFLTFTKDGYDCPDSRENKAVKIYHALFSKKDHKLTVIKGDPFNYSPEIIENNINGGTPVWPSTDMIGKNGEISVSLKGKDLKDRVRTELFKRAPAPETKKEDLKKLAASVSANEDILMIVK
jgi:hypothetical protein